MEELREQQIEALKLAEEYLDKLIPSMEQVVSEIKGEKQEDTVDFLMQIIDGLNFMLDIYNGTRDLVNGEEVLINDEALEISIGVLSRGFASRNCDVIAETLGSDIVPFLKVLKEAAKKLTV